MPYTIAAADNGRRVGRKWRGKKLAPQQVSAESAAQDEEDGRGLPRRGK